MIFEKKRRYSGRPGSRAFYAVVVVCMAAVGIGTWTSVNTNRSSLPEETTEEFSIDWDKYGRESVTEGGERANVPVTGVADERYVTVTRSPSEEETTAADEEQAREENTSQAAEETTQEESEPPASGFVLPMGTKIVKDFSNGELVRNSTTGDWRIHNGVDFAGEEGDFVASVTDGTITSVYDDVLWGTVIEIDHGNGMTARYCGMQSGSSPAVGTEVRQNDVIGRLGTILIESADEPHLHFEVTVDGKTVDPLAAIEH